MSSCSLVARHPFSWRSPPLCGVRHCLLNWSCVKQPELYSHSVIYSAILIFHRFSLLWLIGGFQNGLSLKRHVLLIMEKRHAWMTLKLWVSSFLFGEDAFQFYPNSLINVNRSNTQTATVYCNNRNVCRSFECGGGVGMHYINDNEAVFFHQMESCYTQQIIERYKQLHNLSYILVSACEFTQLCKVWWRKEKTAV